MSMKQVEDRFNKEFRYPYVFLNEQPFDETFIKCVCYLCILLVSKVIDEYAQTGAQAS